MFSLFGSSGTRVRVWCTRRTTSLPHRHFEISINFRLYFHVFLRVFDGQINFLLSLCLYARVIVIESFSGRAQRFWFWFRQGPHNRHHHRHPFDIVLHVELGSFEGGRSWNTLRPSSDDRWCALSGASSYSSDCWSEVRVPVVPFVICGVVLLSASQQKENTIKFYEIYFLIFNFVELWKNSSFSLLCKQFLKSVSSSFL